MFVIRNKFIPFKGFVAMNICGLLFVRKEATITDTILNHEAIHSRQWLECLIVFFPVLYVIEWLFNLFIYRDSKKAYKNISFEKEAFANQYNKNYLKNRKMYAWIENIYN